MNVLLYLGVTDYMKGEKFRAKWYLDDAIINIMGILVKDYRI